jgi:hypothetical protein
MKLLAFVLLGIAMVGCGNRSPLLERETTVIEARTCVVDSDEWGVCSSRCGDAGLSAVYREDNWLTCYCSDLSEIEISLPIDSIVIDGKDNSDSEAE